MLHLGVKAVYVDSLRFNFVKLFTFRHVEWSLIEFFFLNGIIREALSLVVLMIHRVLSRRDLKATVGEASAKVF